MRSLVKDYIFTVSYYHCLRLLSKRTLYTLSYLLASTLKSL